MNTKDEGLLIDALARSLAKNKLEYGMDGL